ncbi:AraC family transcriptional regulator [Paenibacillus sp. GYB004]|uniref:AraC family transcriptional regulator n=1 Tax=Paenibacillus sp. GYB004 TaxID=2994393 RepID=UPI002F962687
MLALHSIYFDDVDTTWRKPLSSTEYCMLILVVRGRLLYRLNGEDIPLQKGDLLYIAAHTMREGLPINGETHQKYSVHFTPDEETLRLFPPLRTDSWFKAESQTLEYGKQRFHILAQQWLGKLAYYEPVCCGIAQELIALACRDYEATRYPHKKHAQVQTMLQYILEHYREPIRIEQLAAIVDRTPNYVTGIFKEITGQPPIDYLHQVRINAAKDLLLNSTMTIAEIADFLGYCDPSYFNRMYKRWTGSVPSSFLKLRLAGTRMKT